MTNLILIILLAIVKAVGGEGIAEKEVAKAVQESLGDRVQAVQVQIDANPATFVAKGKVKRVKFTLDKFKVDPIVIEKTEIDIDGLKINSKEAILGKPAKINEIGPAAWSLVIGVEQLTAAVRKTSPQIETPFFRTVGQDIEFTGKYRLNKYMAPSFKAIGRMRIQDKKRVNLRLHTFEISGLGVPDQIKTMVEDSVNPLLDVDKLMKGKREDIAMYELALSRELNPQIESVSISGGKIHGNGTI